MLEFTLYGQEDAQVSEYRLRQCYFVIFSFYLHLLIFLYVTNNLLFLFLIYLRVTVSISILHVTILFLIYLHVTISKNFILLVFTVLSQ